MQGTGTAKGNQNQAFSDCPAADAGPIDGLITADNTVVHNQDCGCISISGVGETIPDAAAEASVRLNSVRISIVSTHHRLV